MERWRIQHPKLLGHAASLEVSYLSIIVEVWIEANAVIGSCFKVDVHWRLRIVLGKVNIELETSIGVWGV